MTTILVTGSRYYQGDVKEYCDALENMRTNLSLDPNITLIHGGAQGADVITAAEGNKRGWLVEEYLPLWSKCGKAAGPVRNGVLVSKRPHLALALLLSDSVGTRDCLKQLARSTKSDKSRLQHTLLVDLENLQSRWLDPLQLLEEFG